MLHFKKNKGFTLVELIIVIGIIALLVTIGFSSYFNVQKSSRDAKRKTDLDVIRSALEIYKTNNSFYPANLVTLTNDKYIQSIPLDPQYKSGLYYNYSPICDDGLLNCYSYLISTFLEKPPSNDVCTASCGNDPNEDCNYCVGPEGKKEN